MVTVTIIGINLAVFVYGLGLNQREMISLWSQYGAIPLRIANLPSLVLAGNLQVAATVITSQFLHAGLLHILSNMWYLWVFGDNIESRLGGGRYLALYLGSGIAGNVAHTLANPGSIIPTIGASGAVAGVLGAYFLSFPRARILTILPLGLFITFTEVPALLFLLVWIGIQVFNGLTALGAAPAQPVAWWAHVGGFAAGMVLLGLLVNRRHASGPEESGYVDPAGTEKRESRILGLDLGHRRIGIAVSDELGLTAQPVGYVERRRLEDDLAQLDGIVQEHGVGRVLVGLPLHMGGDEGDMAGAARDFGQILATRWGIPVIMWDERLSTVQAERLLVEADMSRRRRVQVRDAVAAAIILQSYLDRQRSGLTER